MVELEADMYVSRPPTYRLDKSMDMDQIQGTGYMQQHENKALNTPDTSNKYNALVLYH